MTTCDRCGKALAIGEFPFCPHGMGTGARIGDECDFYDPNLQRRFTSKSEHDRAIKERGWVRKVKHVGLQGSDKSPYTQRWDTCPAALLISEADRIANLQAWDVAHGLTATERPVALVIPEPEPLFSETTQRQLSDVAAQVGL